MSGTRLLPVCPDFALCFPSQLVLSGINHHFARLSCIGVQLAHSLLRSRRFLNFFSSCPAGPRGSDLIVMGLDFPTVKSTSPFVSLMVSEVKLPCRVENCRYMWCLENNKNSVIVFAFAHAFILVHAPSPQHSASMLLIHTGFSLMNDAGIHIDVCGAPI